MPSNEAIVRQIFDAYNRRDIPGIIEHAADDLVYINAYGVCVDKLGLADEVAAILQTFSHLRWDIERLAANDDLVFVEFHVSGRISGDALLAMVARFYEDAPSTPESSESSSVEKDFRVPTVWVLAFREAKLVYWRVYYNPGLLLAQLRDG